MTESETSEEDTLRLTVNCDDEISLDAQRKTHVYIRNKQHGWIPAELIDRNDDGTATVLCKLSQTIDYESRVKSNNNSRAGFITPMKGSEHSHFNSKKRRDIIHGGDLAQSHAPTEAVLPSSVPSFTSLLNSSSRRKSTTITIDLDDYGGTLPLQNVDDDGKLIIFDDMKDLSFLHEASILYNLKVRYEGETTIPYTRTGDVLLAINPYKWVNGLYAESTRLHYAEELVWKESGSTVSKLPPHLYHISSLAFKGLSIDGQDQSILVSGESGAGKTVSVKILMSHLATFHELKHAYIHRRLGDNMEDANSNNGSTNQDDSSHSKGSYFGFLFGWFRGSYFGCQNSKAVQVIEDDNKSYSDIETPIERVEEPEEMQQTNLIVQRVLDSNPLLEAFGNAKTVLNDNSSRFSKFVKLQFHVEFLGRANPSCNIAGSICDTYLLEKSRVVRHDREKGERTFHIFYQLLSAPSSQKRRFWHSLEDKDASSFKYIGDNSSKTIEGFTDQQCWEKTVEALETIGIKGKKIDDLFRAICIVLQLGNLIFEVDPSNHEGSIIANLNELELLSEIIGIHSDDILKSLTFKTVSIAQDSYQVPLTVAAAKMNCDSFAKEIYSIVFDWLVDAINDATCASKNYDRAKEVSVYRHIGILDIFGFECFEINRFEQLLINHANERLQCMFTDVMISSVQLEYESEGIGLNQVDYINNSNVLGFVEGKMGLIALLNDECFFPKGCDSSFVKKLYALKTQASKSALIFKKQYNLSETMFGIKHYAGTVDYDANHFVVTNTDTLPCDIIECGAKSTNKIVKNGMSKIVKTTRRSGVLIATTLWTKFGRQLDVLFKNLSVTKPWFVRCINPNKQKKPGELDMVYTLSQLRYAGILPALKMSRSAYPNRLTFSVALDRFWFLASYNFMLKKQIAGQNEANKIKRHYGLWKVFAKVVDERENAEILLDHLLKHLQYQSNTDTVIKAFVVGKTKVFFRTGSLEYLESERLKSYDRHATTIQTMFRGGCARSSYIELKKTAPLKKKKETKMIRKMQKMPIVSMLLLPVFIFRFMKRFIFPRKIKQKSYTLQIPSI